MFIFIRLYLFLFKKDLMLFIYLLSLVVGDDAAGDVDWAFIGTKYSTRNKRLSTKSWIMFNGTRLPS